MIRTTWSSRWRAAGWTEGSATTTELKTRAVVNGGRKAQVMAAWPAERLDVLGNPTTEKWAALRILRNLMHVRSGIGTKDGAVVRLRESMRSQERGTQDAIAPHLYLCRSLLGLFCVAENACACIRIRYAAALA